MPTFAHLSMILGPDGKKLSKRHGAASVEEFCERGYLSDAMVNFLALLGWSLDGETTLIDRATLCEKFSLDRVTKKDAVFDETKLDWMNGQYIKEMGASAWVRASLPWLWRAHAGLAADEELSEDALSRAAADLDARARMVLQALPACGRAPGAPRRDTRQAGVLVLGP